MRKMLVMKKILVKQKNKWYKRFLCSSVSKESACKAGDLGSVPGSGRSPGEGTGNPLQYSCLENPMERGAWWASVHGIAESDMTERLSKAQHSLMHKVI